MPVPLQTIPAIPATGTGSVARGQVKRPKNALARFNPMQSKGAQVAPAGTRAGVQANQAQKTRAAKGENLNRFMQSPTVSTPFPGRGRYGA